MNVDSSLHKSNCAGIGGVIRDHRGRFILAFGNKLFRWDIAQLEVLAVLALRNVLQEWTKETKGIWIEGDNSNVKWLLVLNVEPRANCFIIHGDPHLYSRTRYLWSYFVFVLSLSLLLSYLRFVRYYFAKCLLLALKQLLISLVASFCENSKLRHVLLLLCQFINYIEVTRLPVYYPSDREREDPKLYASNVRKLMASESSWYALTFNHEHHALFFESRSREGNSNSRVVEFCAKIRVHYVFNMKEALEIVDKAIIIIFFSSY
ncbi:hypothetical protein M5K25_000603 [Dendrobium thyrsiflorum]|uniref:RNase H type-1 domain-containing protein n=1 Tax=Dendrobium thyrsiflorum TaxID=117978 RepID=A0ABD0VTZ9_DENTH